MTAADSCWQSLGVCFQTTRQPVSPLLKGHGPAELLFIATKQHPWTDAEWDAAEVVGRYARAGSDEAIEIRRDATRSLYHAPWAGRLAIEESRVTGRALRPDTMLSLEMEFLEEALAIHLGRKGVPVFHAAAVEVDGMAIALIAASGGGKSSLAIGLVQAGCGFLSDDVVAVHGAEQLIYPGHLNLRLHPDTAKALLKEGEYRLINPFFDTSKLVTDVSTWGRIQAEPCPLAAIYVVEPRADQPETQIERIPPASAFHVMASSQIGYDSRAPVDRLAGLADLVRRAPVRRISFPRVYAALPSVCASVMDDVRRIMSSSGSR